MFRFPWFRRKPRSAGYADTVPVRPQKEPDKDPPTTESGWLLSSVDLQSGLQVVEGEERTVPGDLDALERSRERKRRG